MSTKSKVSGDSPPTLRSFGEHLSELRGRLAWIALTLILASAFAYAFSSQLVTIVLSPIGDQKLVYLTPAGGFAFIFQIIIYAGMLLTLPFAIYHLYKFISPALPHGKGFTSIKVVVFSSLLMIAGASFGYFAAVPAALQFLNAFAGDFVQANLTADSYLNFLVAYVLGLGLLFQLPLLLILWNWIEPFKPGGLLNTQRFVLVGAFVAAALITPTPDVVNQCLIAVPIIVVYQLGVVSVYMMNRKARSKKISKQRIQSAPQEPRYRPQQNLDKPVFSHHFFSEQPLPQPAAKVIDHSNHKALDGFTPSPKVHVASLQPVKHRSQRRPLPVLRRPASVTRSAPSRAQRSIDGFTFV